MPVGHRVTSDGVSSHQTAYHTAGLAGPFHLFALVGALLTILILFSVTAPSASALPAKFFGLQFATYGEYENPVVFDEIQESGSKYFRANLTWAQKLQQGWGPYDSLFGLAAERGITILPTLYGGSTGSGAVPSPEEHPAWANFVKEVVERYGYGGTFWANGGTFVGDEVTPMPPPAWEVWNEPNLGANGVNGVVSNPTKYRDFLQVSFNAIHAAQAAYPGIQVLLGGLYWEASTGWDGPNGNGSPGEHFSYSGETYLNLLCAQGGAPYFDGLSLHPYAFFGSKAQKVQEEVEAARSALNTKCGGASKPIWVTELGWAVTPNAPTTGNHPAVAPSVQATLLTESFNRLKNISASAGLESVLWYNRIDEAGSSEWDRNCGLQESNGARRASWTAFVGQSGGALWRPNVKTSEASGIQETQATLNGSVNPNGAATTYYFEYGINRAYGGMAPIPASSVGAGKVRVPVSAGVTQLMPGTLYHYRIVASNAHGTSHGPDRTFKTSSYRYMLGTSSGGGVSSWNTVLSASPPTDVASGDFNGDGKTDIVSVEPEGGATYRYMLGISNGSGVSSWTKVLSGMSQPTTMGVGDFTGDGKADIVAVEPDGAGKYQYMLGISSGSGISSWTKVLSGMSQPTTMGVGDFTGDKKADIVSAEPDGAGKYQYMVGTSSGSGISSWTKVLSGMSQPTTMGVGDFTGDKKADIVAAEPDGAGKYQYMVGTSSGGGISSWTKVQSGMRQPEVVSIGDFTGDGKADIVAVEPDGASKYQYMLGISSGSGISSWNKVLSGMSLAGAMDVGDLTGDGKVDLIAVEADSGGSYHYMLGTSSGSGVSSWTPVQSGMRRATAMRTADFTGDGKADIVAVEPDGAGKYQYMLGISNGSGVSSWTKVLSGMSQPTAYNVGDFTGDGKADIVAVEPDGASKYQYMLGTSSGSGVSSWTKVLSGMSQPTTMGVGDFTGDGKADIVAVEPDGAGKYQYMLGISSGSGISSWTKVLSGMSQPTAYNVGDFTGDGKADIVAVEPDGASKYQYMLGTSSGSGVSSWTKVLSGMTAPTVMRVGDYTGDGKADIVSAEPDGASKYQYMVGTSSGSGISSWSKVLSGMSAPWAMGVGDVTGDGKADILAGENSP